MAKQLIYQYQKTTRQTTPTTMPDHPLALAAMQKRADLEAANKKKARDAKATRNAMLAMLRSARDDDGLEEDDAEDFLLQTFAALKVDIVTVYYCTDTEELAENLWEEISE